MKFTKGKKKTGGRKPGSVNKVTRVIKEFATEMLEDRIYRKKLLLRLRAGKAQRIEELLYAYAYGRPLQKLEMSGELTLEELVLGSFEVEEK